MIQAVQIETRKLEAVEAVITTLPQNEELQSHFAKYLCVVVSGYLEECVRKLFEAYAKGKCTPQIASFIAGPISDITNLKETKLRELLGRFDPLWADRFETQLPSEEKDAIDSVVSIRHQVAHGRSYGVSLGTAMTYTKRVKAAVRLLDERCINWRPIR